MQFFKGLSPNNRREHLYLARSAPIPILPSSGAFRTRSVHNIVQLHKLDPLLRQFNRAGSAAVCGGMLFARIVNDTLKPRSGQQIRMLFKVRIAPLQIIRLRKNRAEYTALPSRAAGFDCVERHRR